MNDKILLKNANIIDEQAGVTANVDLLIEDGKIKGIYKGSCEFVDAKDYTDEYRTAKDSAGEYRTAKNNPDEYVADGENTDEPEVIDCTGKYISCGLASLHCHCAMNMFKGIAEDVDSDTWFNERIFPYESKLTPDDVYLGTRLGIMEMIDSGVTVFADHYFNEEAVLQAVLDMGIRADIAPTIFGMAPDFEARLDEVEGFYEDHKNDSELVSIRLGPHAPYTCPGDTLRKISDRAKKLGCGLHIHISETREQVEESLKLNGKTPFEVSAESGIFDNDVIVAHGLWATDSDLKLTNERTWFAFCPKTYQKLAMGYGNILKHKDDIRYSFGTDGAASSNTLNIIEQARHCALLGKFCESDATISKAHDIWKAMMRGHEAFGFNSGRIKEGCAADLVIWDLDRPNTFPVYDPVSTILYSSDTSNVISTIVNGRFLKKDGHLMTDEFDTYSRGNKLIREILSRGKGNSDIVY